MNYIEYKDNNGKLHKVPTFSQKIIRNKNPSSNYDKYSVEFPEELLIILKEKYDYKEANPLYMSIVNDSHILSASEISGSIKLELDKNSSGKYLLRLPTNKFDIKLSNKEKLIFVNMQGQKGSNMILLYFK